MTFNSINFLIFFPIVVLVYFLIAQKVRWIWLLISSYYFYMSWNPKYLLLIVFSTVVTWIGGIQVEKVEESDTIVNKIVRKKLYLWICLISNLAILGFFKYHKFFIQNVNSVLGKVGIQTAIPVFDVLLPVGISFYTFQALGYLIDVYRGTIKAEKNLFRYALFVSFFPQLVAGPIERSKNLIHQVHAPHYFDAERVVRGLLLMGWGFFKKLIIADRAALLVTGVYDHYTDYFGLQIIVATIVFAIQIYCDFSGYSDIAIGAARVMGFDLMENFHSPYFSKSVSEFWRRWHISLTTWFRDYLYIPLGGNRKGKIKKYRNILITFGLSGLWHGASWNYVAWGVLNGCYQIVGDVTQRFRDRVKGVLHINTVTWSYRFFQGIITFAFVDFAWLFFRAVSLKEALKMILHAIRNPGIMSMLDTSRILGIQTLVLDEKDFYVMLIAIMILIVVDAIKDKVAIGTFILQQNIVSRYIIYYMIIFTILIFGIYGPEFDASTFIYFQF